jgi:hypothetical protein
MMANGTSAHPGAFDPQTPGAPGMGASSGIGLGPLASGPDANNFTVDANNDLVLPFIGALGNIVVEPTTLVAGSGYTDGRYRVQSAGGGQPNGTAAVDFLVTGGVIVWARVSRPGSGFTSAPTFTVANALDANGNGPGGGTGATITATIGTAAKPTAMIVPAGNKPMRRVVAAGPVAIDAAVTPGTYLNKSGRALVAGDELWAVAP